MNYRLFLCCFLLGCQTYKTFHEDCKNHQIRVREACPIGNQPNKDTLEFCTIPLGEIGCGFEIDYCKHIGKKWILKGRTYNGLKVASNLEVAYYEPIASNPNLLRKIKSFGFSDSQGRFKGSFKENMAGYILLLDDSDSYTCVQYIKK